MKKQSKVRYFECIKSFDIERADDDGVLLDDEPPFEITKGTIWEVSFWGDKPNWVSYQTNGNGRMMYFEKEHWEDTEYFKEVEVSQ